MEPEVAFGKVLRALRKQAGLSQERLALDADIQRNYVSLLELGQHQGSVQAGCSPEDFPQRDVGADGATAKTAPMRKTLRQKKELPLACESHRSPQLS